MALMKVRPNQLYREKSWHGLTHRNHLWSIGQEDPYVVLDKVKQLYDVNLEMDEISFIEKFGTYKVKDRVFRWKLQGRVSRNYPLVGAWEDRSGASAVGTTTDRVGAVGASFYLDFAERCFSITEVIVGHKPDKYGIYLADDPISINGIWRYRCELISSNVDFYIPAEELAVGNEFSSDYGLVTDTLSDRGFETEHSSPAELQAETSVFRMQETIPGNMINSGKTRPLKFWFKGEDGKEHMSWISELEWSFLLKAKKTRARLVKYGKSNRYPDGTYSNKHNKNGFYIKAGSGWKEQWSPSNKHTFGLKPSFDHLERICLDATVGKTSNTVFTITAGKWGMRQLHQMVADKMQGDYLNATWLQDHMGRAFNWNDNEIAVKLGQFTKVALINGIVWIFVEDPTKDDPIRNKTPHPLGGLASSYEYDIMGFGSEDEKSNMQIVEVEGEEPVYGVVAGLRSPWGSQGAGKAFASARNIANSIDGSTIHYQETVGSIVWDPTKIIQYYPEILQ